MNAFLFILVISIIGFIGIWSSMLIIEGKNHNTIGDIIDSNRIVFDLSWVPCVNFIVFLLLISIVITIWVGKVLEKSNIEKLWEKIRNIKLR
jgi:hypothetical protein